MSEDCDMQSEFELFPSQTLFLPAFHDPKVFKQIFDVQGCIAVCKDQNNDCSALIYNNRSLECRLYTKSLSYSYEEFLIDDTDEKAFVSVCTSGRCNYYDPLFGAGRNSSVGRDVALESRGTVIDPRVRHILS